MSNNIKNESIKKKRSFVLLLWVLPFLALLISSWMVYKHLNEQGEEITVYFDSADGFVVNKTQLKYKGIKIGIVSKINMNQNDLNEFIITLKVNEKIKDVIAKEGTIFWKIEPKASLTEISGLNTILSGVYIEVSPPSDKISEIKKAKNQTIFKAVNEKPINLFKNKGISIILSSNKSSLSVGAPILYKSFIVGKILKKSLKDEKILYTIFIENKYKKLIKKNSNFWKINSVDLKASLSSIELKIESLATLITGGITFDSKKEDNKLLDKNNKIFKLYDSKDEILFDDKIIVLTQEGTKGLDKSLSQIFYNGFVIGKVVDSQYFVKTNESKFFVKLKKDYIPLLKHKTYFYIATNKFSFDNLKKITNVLKSNYIELKNYSNKTISPTYDYVLHNADKKQRVYKVRLKTKDSVKITKGSAVYYKNIKVGIITYKKLLKKGSEIRVGLDIFWKYRYLINDSSLFFIESPIEINASLSGVNIRTAPLMNYINSGVSFETSNLKEKSTGSHFQLLSSYQSMVNERYLQKKADRFIIEVQELTSLNKNDFIYYKGVEAGKVLNTKYNNKSKKIDIELFIFKQFSSLINLSTRFYSIGGFQIDVSLDKINIKTKSLDTLIKGAISFITLDKKAKKAKKHHRFKFFKNLEDAKEKFVNVSILMKRAFNLKKGSKLYYKGIRVGIIKKLEFKENNMIVAYSKILKTQENLLREDSIFYLNDFKFSLNKIENTKAAFLGPDISIIKGKSNIKKSEFNLFEHKPLQDFDKKGLRIIVKAKRKSSLKQNSPIYYRQVKIGAVEKYTLAKDSTHVKLQLFIDDKYQHLVRNNSIFYNAGAFGVDLHLFGIKIKTETLQTLINGGISMVTPTIYGEKASFMKEYKLFEDVEEEWLQWNPKINKIKKGVF